MIRALTGVLAMWFLSPPALAGEAGSPAAPAGDAEQQLLELEQTWIRAEIGHDAAALRGILADQFVSTFGTGEPLDKEAFIKEVTGGNPDPTLTQTLSDHTMRIAGDTAIVVETDTIRHTRNGTPVTSAWRFTVTYIRRNGRWVELAEHGVRIPPPP